MKALLKANIAMILFLLFATSTQAQYGGSAYVDVKNNKGNNRTLNVTTTCYHASESAMKRKLESELRNEKRSDEEFNSQIYYSIDKCSSNNKQTYSGSVSVRVRDSKGKTRTLNTSTTCYHKSKSAAKVKLEGELANDKRYNEEFISAINYDIDSCN